MSTVYSRVTEVDSVGSEKMEHARYEGFRAMDCLLCEIFSLPTESTSVTLEYTVDIFSRSEDRSVAEIPHLASDIIPHGKGSLRR